MSILRNGHVTMSNLGVKGPYNNLTSYLGSPVARLRAINSSCMVVTSDVLLSGPQRGGWGIRVLRFTSE